MELRELAERILFATSLEEKLQCPDSITDDQPGSALIAPEVPGRPASLTFKHKDSAKSEFPGVHALEDERERGRLLHFFANHELLATELMALALLRFPEAPAAFRRGVLQTLKDEQAHTRMYLARMKSCGIEFGELPVSGYFWRSVSSMENPIDYVSGLSLTFEQANLDFARHFAMGFQTVGDKVTAQLLDKIYRDEIAHVAYGLKWFRRWKNPSESDWDAFCRQLKFPLSPQRAKGFSINVEARRAAGFDPNFIAELEVYSHSKGRTPAVFVFNPFEEGRIARGKTFTPVKHQVQLAQDLASLPQFLCRQDDIVLVPRRPSVQFLGGIKRAGFALPEFVEMKEGRIDSKSPLMQRKLATLRPWAWGPDSVELLSPLFGNVTGESRSAEQRFNTATARLYSKAWSAELLGNFLDRSESAPWLCTRNEVGVAASNPGDVLKIVAEIRKSGHHKIIIKEAIGLAGHNAIRLWEPEVLETQRRWIESATAGGREVVVEPWLEREIDFSVQLEMTEHGLKLAGYTGLITDRKGQFQANWASPTYVRRLPDAVTTLFREPRDIVVRLHKAYEAIFAVLDAELRRVGYVGPVGIDAFVYRAADGALRLKPIVEINPRYTMGRLTVELMKQACPGTHGMFELVNHAKLKSEGHAGFSAYANALSERPPLRLEGKPQPRIREGAVCLNDPLQAQVVLAVFRVSPRAPFQPVSCVAN